MSITIVTSENENLMGVGGGGGTGSGSCSSSTSGHGSPPMPYGCQHKLVEVAKSAIDAAKGCSKLDLLKVKVVKWTLNKDQPLAQCSLIVTLMILYFF